MNIIEIVRMNIKKYMRLKNISQKEIAEKLDFTPVYISNLLSGKRGESLKLDVLNKLAEIFEIPLTSLITENTIDEPNDKNYRLITEWIKKLYLSDNERAKGRFEAEFETYISGFKNKHSFENAIDNFNFEKRERRKTDIA